MSTAERSVAWITRHLSGFAPTSDSGEVSSERVKRLIELAFIHHYLSAWHGGLLEWRTFLRRWCEHDDYLRMALSDKDRGLYRMQPYFWLRASGDRSEACEHVVRELWAAGKAPDSVGVLHALWKAGYVRDEPDWAGLLRGTVLRWRVPVESETWIGYRLTHAVFYATDLGAHPLPLKDEESDRLGQLAERALRHWTELGNWDLAGELLIALHCLGRQHTPDYARARRALDLARRADGSMPNSSSPDKPDEPDELDFRRCYHPTTVDAVRNAMEVAA